jgi:hypothetical protein
MQVGEHAIPSILVYLSEKATMLGSSDEFGDLGINFK